MKKIFFIFTSVSLLAVGCGVVKNTTTSTYSQSAQSTTESAASTTTAPNYNIQNPPEENYIKGKTFSGGQYSNDEYGFSFTFPLDNNVSEFHSQHNFLVEIETPQTQKLIDETAGELSDAVSITPKENIKDLSDNLALPSLQFSENYFEKNASVDNFGEYLGKVVVGGKVGYQIFHSEANNSKYTIFDNGDGTAFVLIGTYLNLKDSPRSIGDYALEPYDLILKSLKFNK